MSSDREDSSTKEIATTSSISSITVYLDHALVTRTAQVKCSPGTNEFAFEGLPSEIDDNSLRVKADAGTVCGVRVERVFLERAEAEELRGLQDEVQALLDQQQAFTDEVSVLDTEQEFLESLRMEAPQNIKRSLASGTFKLPDVEGTGALLEILVKRLSANRARRREIDVGLRELSPKLDAKQRELTDKQATGRLEEKKVSVVLESEDGSECDLHLSYLLPGAMWFPSYDLRAKPDGGKLKVAYYAIIQQATGEDWEDAKLTLGASRPAQATHQPRLTPWLLGDTAVPFEAPGMPSDANLSQAEAPAQAEESYQQGVQIEAQFAKRGKKMKKAHEKLLRNVERVYRVMHAVAARGTSLAFTVPGRASIPTDGKPHRVVLTTADLDLGVEYSAVPDLSLATYITGKAVNTSGLPLLGGEANVYINGDLVGKSTLDFVAPGEEAGFCLGIEESLKVTRSIDGKQSSLRSFGKRQRFEIACSVKLENFKQHRASVRITEALPESQDSDIRVKISIMSPKPVKTQRGITEWLVDVPPEGQETINFAYSIDYPIDKAEVTASSEAMQRQLQKM